MMTVYIISTRTAKTVYTAPDWTAATTLDDEGIDPDIVYNLTPRIFDEAPDDVREIDEGNIMGFVAEEVHEVCPDIIMYDENGNIEMYSTDAVQALTIGALQKLRDRVAELEKKAGVRAKKVPPKGASMKNGRGLSVIRDRRKKDEKKAVG